jgi:hypothetical protein
MQYETGIKVALLFFVECPANFVPVCVIGNWYVKGPEKQYQSEG